jgi:hypothetical protein
VTLARPLKNGRTVLDYPDQNPKFDEWQRAIFQATGWVMALDTSGWGDRRSIVSAFGNIDRDGNPRTPIADIQQVDRGYKVSGYDDGPFNPRNPFWNWLVGRWYNSPYDAAIAALSSAAIPLLVERLGRRLVVDTKAPGWWRAIVQESTTWHRICAVTADVHGGNVENALGQVVEKYDSFWMALLSMAARLANEVLDEDRVQIGLAKQNDFAIVDRAQIDKAGEALDSLNAMLFDAEVEE